MLRMKKHRFLMTLAAMSVVLGVMLCGCGAAQNNRPRSSAPASTSKSSSSKSSSSGNSSSKSSSSGNSSSKSSSSGSSSSKSSSSASNTEYNTVEAISGIAGLKAYVEETGNGVHCAVYTDDDHNPYDVVWDYGREYRKFVEAVDKAGMWDVLFDADFYKEHYPMLAQLYHDEEDLLLEHFQTVGIHEGRQGSDAFNVAAYMENCNKKLADAFGDAYECYYFYWALNQDSESGIDTQSDGHPIQMTIKLTTLQKTELKKVNEYRAEVGADPVTVHPEFLAFANYRAWCDFTGDYEGHEWFYAHQDYLASVLKSYGASKLGENTVYGNTTATGPSPKRYYDNYRKSEKHYETMVSTKYRWFGCSNTYWGPDGRDSNRYGFKYCEYDLYMDTMSTYSVGTP